MRVLAVIPARLASTRLPRKPLASIAGHPMIEWVYRAAAAASAISRVVVATDSEEVAQTVQGFGGEAMLTRPDHPSGTDRMAEVAARLPDYPVLVNVQGDEPLLRPEPLDALVAGFLAQAAAPAGTLVRRAVHREEIDSPQTAKVARAQDGAAIYFSRAPVPFLRSGGEAPTYFIHIGVYIHRREFLLAFAGMPRGPLEKSEMLEQLRVLENGHRMMTVETGAVFCGVDTAEDLERVRAVVAARRLEPVCPR
ncbi:MAG: 3-deoxy-manno-octulosonate cytidylyltransferase [Candidatus Wallbacteria bacterium]|nr:3-deoxy-manno-octulosonate cytidylyltransferase [Candidatus Wallbacteria bacterium]